MIVNLCIARARLHSLLKLDTRIVEIQSAVLKIMWALGLYYFVPYSEITAFGRVDDFLPGGLIVLVLVPIAMVHIAMIVLNNPVGRRVCILFGIAWWTWLTALMILFPPNYSAAITYLCVALFCFWSFLSLGGINR